MKKTLLLIAITFSVSAFSQEKKDTTQPQIKTVYIFDHADTIKVNTLLYKGEAGVVKYCSPGWEIWTGKAFIADDKKRYWVTNGQLTGALDDKRRPVKPIN